MGYNLLAIAEKHHRRRSLDLLRLHHERIEAWVLEQAGIAFDAKAEPGTLRVVAAYWQQASVKRGRGRPAAAVKRPTLNMRVDADVLEAFRATGRGWQTRINAALREAVAHGLNKA